MKVNLNAKPTIEFSWPSVFPEDGPLRPEDAVVITIGRLTHEQRTQCENSMVAMRGDHQKSARGAKKTSDTTLQMLVGSVKNLRMKNAVKGWDNVNDENGNPINYSFEKLTQMCISNFDVDPDMYGIFESELVEAIESHNSFAETTKVNPKNSEKGLEDS